MRGWRSTTSEHFQMQQKAMVIIHVHGAAASAATVGRPAVFVAGDFLWTTAFGWKIGMPLWSLQQKLHSKQPRLPSSAPSLRFPSTSKCSPLPCQMKPLPGCWTSPSGNSQAAANIGQDLSAAAAPVGRTSVGGPYCGSGAFGCPLGWGRLPKPPHLRGCNSGGSTSPVVGLGLRLGGLAAAGAVLWAEASVAKQRHGSGPLVSFSQETRFHGEAAKRIPIGLESEKNLDAWCPKSAVSCRSAGPGDSLRSVGLHPDRLNWLQRACRGESCAVVSACGRIDLGTASECKTAASAAAHAFLSKSFHSAGVEILEQLDLWDEVNGWGRGTPKFSSNLLAESGNHLDWWLLIRDLSGSEMYSSW